MASPFDNDQESLALTFVVVREGIFPGVDDYPNNDPHYYRDWVTMGAVRIFAGNFAIGQDAANGALLQISLNTPLFSLLGTEYGGNGQSTFAVPNLLDRTPVGIGAASGLPTVTLAENFGATDVTLTQAQLPAPFGSNQSFDNYQPSLGLTYLIQTAGASAIDPMDVNDNRINTTAFVGSVEAFASGIVPDGYLPADGRLLLISEYESLFAAIGTIYGGDGATTFALPDLRGRTVIGADSRPGGHELGDYLGNDDPSVGPDNLPPSLGGSSQPIDNHEPSLALNYLIAVEGVFPQRENVSAGSQNPYLGEVIIYAGMAVPDGFVRAEGQLLSIAQNQALFSLLGTQYGGDGRSTFALPDLRGRAVVGAGHDYTVGDIIGSDGIVLTDANLPPLPPELTASAGTTLALEQLATAIDPTLALVDYDSATLASATVSITAGFHSGEDVLAFLNDGAHMGNISSSYDAASGVLTLTSLNASATLAEWQAALRAVTYTDTSDTPDTTGRTISFAVNDGALASGAVTKAVGVIAVDDAPTAQDGNASGHENHVITGALAASDPDSVSLSYSAVSGPAHGSLALNADGTFTYTPDMRYSGADSFTFKANDGALDSNVATIHLTIEPAFQYAGSVDLGSRPVYEVAGAGDFNHDGTADVLWRNPTTGAVDEWTMQNGNWSKSNSLGSRSPDTKIAGIGDFNGDGTSDVLWRDANGHLDVWIMQNGQWSASIDLGSHGADWKVLGVGDFDGDGTSDILFQNATGQLDSWRMHDGNWSASQSLGSFNPAWSFAGTGDFDGDGTSDILWRNPATGQVEEWHMAGGNWSSSISLGSFSPAFAVGAVNDFNGDGTSDILWRNPSTGEVDGWMMQNGQWSASVSLGSYDPAYRLAATGDFNHAGGADVLWHNATTGQTGSWLLG